MKFNSFRMYTVAWVMLLLAVAPVAVAQDDTEETGADDEEKQWTGLLLEAAVWVAQPKGSDYAVATQLDPSNPVATDVLYSTQGTARGGRYRLGFEFPARWGGIELIYYSLENDTDLMSSTPGIFGFGESEAYPLFAGARDNGLADYFAASTVTRLRDFRIDYTRRFVSTARLDARWFVGWRRVYHSREIDLNYQALAPGFPPILPPVSTPRPGLDPSADVVMESTKYEGRGPEAGMDFLLNIWNERIYFESGFAVAVLRGTFTSSYESTTNFYSKDDNGQFSVVSSDELNDLLNNPLLIGQLGQFPYSVGLDSGSVSGDAQVLDIYLGLRGRIWRDLEGFAGFRATRYQDVALQMRPNQSFGTTATGSQTFDSVQDLIDSFRTSQDFTREIDSVGYEGFYGGLAYRF